MVHANDLKDQKFHNEGNQNSCSEQAPIAKKQSAGKSSNFETNPMPAKADSSSYLCVKLTRKVRVKNALGLHARPASVIVKLLQGIRSEVTFSYRRESVNAKSIMSILMLAASKNSLITVIVEGEDAAEAMEKIVESFENNFGE